MTYIQTTEQLGDAVRAARKQLGWKSGSDPNLQFFQSKMSRTVTQTARAALVVGALLVLVAALLPVPEAHVRFFDWQDKVEHVVLFAVLTLLALKAWPGHRAWVLGAVLAYGVGIEVAQGFMPARQASLADVAADVLGVGLAVWLNRRKWSLTKRAALDGAR